MLRFAAGFCVGAWLFHQLGAIPDALCYVLEILALLPAAAADEERGRYRELMEDWPETAEALAEVERRARANPLYVNNLISQDARFTTLVIEIDPYSSVAAQTDVAAPASTDLKVNTSMAEPSPSAVDPPAEPVSSPDARRRRAAIHSRSSGTRWRERSVMITPGCTE